MAGWAASTVRGPFLGIHVPLHLYWAKLGDAHTFCPVQPGEARLNQQLSILNWTYPASTQNIGSEEVTWKHPVVVNLGPPPIPPTSSAIQTQPDSSSVRAKVTQPANQAAHHPCRISSERGSNATSVRVASANLGEQEFRPWCEKQLIRFFNDPDQKVRQESGNCFRHLEGEPLEEYASLIDAYCHGAAFNDNSQSLVYALEGSVERLPGVVCSVCEVFLSRFGAEARDFRTHRAFDGHNASRLIFRVYHQHQRDEWGSRSLDVIDRLCQEGVGDVMAQLQQFDR